MNKLESIKKEIREWHPDWSCDRVAREAQRELKYEQELQRENRTGKPKGF